MIRPRVRHRPVPPPRPEPESVSPDQALPVVFILTAEPSDRALARWFLGDDWLSEELFELGVKERIA
jgi:hypothetical protein